MRTLMLTAIALTGCAFAHAALVQTASAQSVPVRVGGEPDLDACGGYGEVAGLKKDGDGFLAVRKGPGTNYAMIDKIHNGQGLSLCDQRGPWVGVV